MQGGRVLLLGGDIDVTGHAQLGHGRFFPDRRMAGRAFAAQIGMRSYASQRDQTRGNLLVHQTKIGLAK